TFVLNQEMSMAKNPLAAHPPWRRLLIISAALPLMIALAALAFGWPAARLAPRGVPVGIVISGPARQLAVEALTRAEPCTVDLRLYDDEASARQAIEHRDVYGAFVVTTSQITVLEASAAGPTVARLLNKVGQQIASQGHERAAGSTSSQPSLVVASVDVVATS